MQIPKLSPFQWLAIVKSVLPIVGSLIRVAGIGVVGLVRAAVDIIGQLESIYSPTSIAGPNANTGAKKREEFVAIMASAFATAEERADETAETLGRLADALVSALNEFGVLPRSLTVKPGDVVSSLWSASSTGSGG